MAGDGLASAIAEQAAASGFGTAWRVVRRLPEDRALALFDRAAAIMHERDGRGVQRLRSNLARVRPELSDEGLDELTREGVRSYLRYCARPSASRRGRSTTSSRGPGRWTSSA